LTDHLSLATLNALADGELSGDRLANVDRHLADCPQCTSIALAQSLLKSATARAGQRYSAPPDLRERLQHLRERGASRAHTTPTQGKPRHARGFVAYGWAAAAALLLACVSLFVIERDTRRASAENAGLVTEVCDQHIATLAANAPPEVISSDRHTVKPWFQGKLPFSFNLPQNLPGDTTLDGANLTYLHNQPAAQLLYSIGKHRVSVFVQQGMIVAVPDLLTADHSGFHVTGFRTADLEVTAVSDVDPARLSDLARLIEQAQTSPSGSTQK
jgi:anti-sigma factor RsiW